MNKQAYIHTHTVDTLCFLDPNVNHIDHVRGVAFWRQVYRAEANGVSTDWIDHRHMSSYGVLIALRYARRFGSVGEAQND